MKSAIHKGPPNFLWKSQWKGTPLQWLSFWKVGSLIHELIEMHMYFRVFMNKRGETMCCCCCVCLDPCCDFTFQDTQTRWIEYQKIKQMKYYSVRERERERKYEEEEEKKRIEMVSKKVTKGITILIKSTSDPRQQWWA